MARQSKTTARKRFFINIASSEESGKSGPSTSTFHRKKRKTNVLSCSSAEKDEACLTQQSRDSTRQKFFQSMQSSEGNNGKNEASTSTSKKTRRTTNSPKCKPAGKYEIGLQSLNQEPDLDEISIVTQKISDSILRCRLKNNNNKGDLADYNN